MMGETLAVISGVVIQLLFAYFPGLSQWYEKQSGTAKGALQLLVLALVAFGGFLPVCFGWFVDQLPLECSQAGVEKQIANFFLALASNQGTWLTVVKPNKAKKA